MKYINPIILTAFLGPLLVGCSSDTSSGGGSSITLNRGGGEEAAAAFAETSASSSGTTLTDSTGVYEAYVDRYPDLLAHYTSSGSGQTKSAFGQTHYCAFGKSEGRTIDASVYCTTPTTTTSTGSTTSASTSSTSSTSHERVEEIIEEVTHRIVEKLLLQPTEQLKAVTDEKLIAAYTEAVNHLFNLVEESDEIDTEKAFPPTRPLVAPPRAR